MSTAQERVSFSFHCIQHASNYLWRACLCAWPCWPWWAAATGPWPRRTCTTSEWVASNGKSHTQFHVSHAKIIRREVTFPCKAGFSEETEPIGWISISTHRHNCRERTHFILKNCLTWLSEICRACQLAGNSGKSWRLESKTWRAGMWEDYNLRQGFYVVVFGWNAFFPGKPPFFVVCFPPSAFCSSGLQLIGCGPPPYPGWSPLLKANQLSMLITSSKYLQNNI